MKIRKKTLFIVMTIISISIIATLMEKDMTAHYSDIVQVVFTNNQITEKDVSIHADVKILDGYKVLAMQIDEQPKVENVNELNFTVTENRDYTVKVYYQSLTEQKELTETFTTTIDSIENQNNVNSLLTDSSKIIKTSNGYTFDKSIGTITKYTKQSGVTEIEIPNSIDGVAVESIGDEAFSECSLVRITIPEGVTKIGGGAFLLSPNLETIHLPNSLKNIDISAFEQCEKLQSMYIPDSVEKISEGLFYGCINLKDVYIGKSVTSIEDLAFSECNNLQNIHFPDKLEKIGLSAFSGCGQLKSITLPNSVKSLGENAFSFCHQLEEVNIPQATRFDGQFIFWNTYNIKSVVLPIETVMTMDARNFRGSLSIEKCLIMYTNPDDIDKYEVKRGFEYVPPFYRGVVVGQMDLKVDKIYSIQNKSRTINLETIFDNKGIVSSTIYEGEKGMEVYTGDDVKIPDLYLNMPTPSQYQLLGKPTSTDTKIVGNQLYIGADERATDLSVSGSCLSDIKEVPISIVEVESIEIKNEPQNQYNIGDYYNPEGLTIIAHYKDKTSEEIIYDNSTKDLFDFLVNQLAWDTKYQIIRYGDKSIQHNISVYKETILNDLLNKVNIEGLMTYDTTLVSQETIDNDLLKDIDKKQVLGEKQYMISSNVKDNITLTYFTDEINNGKTFFLHYKDKKGQVNIIKSLVKDSKIQVIMDNPVSFLIYMNWEERIRSIKIKEEPKDTYLEGENYDPKGLIITVTYNDNSQEDIQYNEENKKDFTFKFHKLDLTIIKQIIGYKGKNIEQSLYIQPKYINLILKDDCTQTYIQGNFSQGSYLEITPVNQVAEKLNEGLENKNVIGQYEVRIVGEYKGHLFITFDIGEEYNGKKVYIKHLKEDGSIEMFVETVIGGKVGITVNELSPFVIYMDSDIHNELYSHFNNKPDIIVKKEITQTEDYTNIGVYMILGVLSLLFMRVGTMRKTKITVK